MVLVIEIGFRNVKCPFAGILLMPNGEVDILHGEPVSSDAHLFIDIL